MAFRAALVELATDVQRLEVWEPLVQPIAPPDWLVKPLEFVTTKDLLAKVWIPGPLWNRIMGLVTNIQAYVDVITGQIGGLPPDAMSRGEYVSQLDNIKNLHRIIDLYLKQLACYLTAEMRRQRLTSRRERRDERPLFMPLRYHYDAGFKSVDRAVLSLESGHVWPPFTPQAPEPDDPAYRDCALKRLMEIAGQKSDEYASAIREGRIALPFDQDDTVSDSPRASE